MPSQPVTMHEWERSLRAPMTLLVNAKTQISYGFFMLEKNLLIPALRLGGTA